MSQNNFTMGNETKVIPKWIWYPENRTLPGTFVFFRKEFDLTSDVVSSHGHISADSRYQLLINGKRIQRGTAPFDPRHMITDPLNVQPYLKKGKNVIGVLVCYLGHGEGGYIPGIAGLNFNLSITTGTEQINIVSDSRWKCHRAGCWKAGMYKRNFCRALQEDFNANLYPYGWEQVGYDESLWQKAKELSVPGNISAAAWGGGNHLCLCPEDGSSFTMEERSIPYMSETRETAKEIIGSGYVHWKVSPGEFFDAYTENAYEEDS